MSCFRDSSEADHRIDDVLHNAQWILDTGKGMLSLCPIPGLDVVASTLSVLIGMVLQTRGNESTRKDLANEIQLLATIVEKTLKQADIPIGNGEGNSVHAKSRRITSPELEERVSTLIQNLKDLTIEASKLSEGSFLTKCFRSKSNADTLLGLKAGVEVATRNFSIQGQVTIEMLVNGVVRSLEHIDTNVEAMKNNHNKDMNEKALESLGFVNARYSSSLNPTTSGVLEGTRTELLRELTQWTVGPDQNGYDPLIYVLSGGVGTGKSTIAFEMAKKLDHDNKLAASFFFVRNAEKLNTTRHVLPTIAYQLARSHPDIYPHIAAAADTYIKQGKHGQQLEFDLEDLIIKPLKEVSSSHPRLTIIIDALDECTESAQDEVVQLLYLFMQRIPEIPFPLRILITTRPEMHIQDVLDSVNFRKVSKPFKLHDIPMGIVDGDIKLFLSKRIEALSCRDEVFNARPTVIEDLTHHAGGLFVYAATVINFLKRNAYHAVETLNVLLSDDPIGAAFSLRQLDRLYLTVLQRAFDEDDLRHPRIKEWIRTVLGSIALLEDHVSMPVLQDIVGVGVNDARYVLGRLGSVLLIPEDQNGEVRVLHSSFPQFLIDRQRCENEIFYIDALVHHGRLAFDCLKILTSTSLLVENVCRLEDPLLPKSDIRDLQDRIKEFIPEHLRYACMHWAIHLSKSKMTPEIMELMVEFTSTKLLAWLEVLIFLNRLDIAVTASGRARTWLLQNDTSTNTQNDMAAIPELMNDVTRFILEFFSPINKCAGQIYNSALPLSPSCKLTALYASTGTSDRVHCTTRMITPRAPTWGSLLRVVETDAFHIHCVAFSPEGLYFASGSDVVQIWDASTGTIKKTLVGDGHHFICLAWAPNGKHIVACSNEGTFRVWSTVSGAQVHMESVPSGAENVAWNPNGTQIIVATSQSSLHVWTVTPGKDIKVANVITGIKDVQAISKNTNYAISAPWGGVLSVWDIGKGDSIELQMPKHTTYLTGCAEFLHHDTQVIAYGEDEDVIVWDLETGKCIHMFHYSPPSYHAISKRPKLAVSPNGDLVAIGNTDSDIHIWDSRTWELLDVLTNPTGLFSMSFSSDNERLVSTFWRTILVWDLTQRALKPSPSLPSNSFARLKRKPAIHFIVFSTDGSHIAALAGGRIRVLSSQSGLQLCEFVADCRLSAAFSPDVQMLAIPGWQGIQIWDLRSTEPSKRFFSGQGNKLSEITWSPNGRWLAGTSVDAPRQICVLDAKTGALIKKLKLDARWVTISLEFSHDSTMLHAKSFPFDIELIFKWEEGICVDVKEHRWKIEVERREYELDDGWVTRKKDGRRMCWLPKSRRYGVKAAEATWGDYYAVGTDSGDVTVLDFGTKS